MPQSESEHDGWAAVRDDFVLDPKVVQLAGLLLASHPTPVREALRRHRDGLDRNPTLYYHDNGSNNEANARSAAGRYMECSPDDVALTDSTTMGLATLYAGIELRSDQIALTTAHDHYSTHESLRLHVGRTGARVDTVPLYEDARGVTAAEMVERLLARVTDATRVVAITHVHSSTGVKTPVRAIANALGERNRDRAPHERALLCVDGVHGFGVEDATPAGLGCDFFVAGTHKWIFGPRGTGIIWGNPEVSDLVQPSIPSFNVETLHAKIEGRPRPPMPFGKRITPGGFHSFEHRWAVAEAFDYHLELGKARIQERTHALATVLKDGLAEMKHVRLVTPSAPEVSSGIVCFDVDGVPPHQVVERLRAKNIVMSRTPYYPTLSRLTPTIYNTPAELDRALAEVAALA